MTENEPNVISMDDAELTKEIHLKLSAIDVALSDVFKTHTPFPGGTLTELEHSVAIIRNLERTMEELRNVNPMSLIKSLMGL